MLRLYSFRTHLHSYPMGPVSKRTSANPFAASTGSELCAPIDARIAAARSRPRPLLPASPAQTPLLEAVAVAVVVVLAVLLTLLLLS